MDHHHLAYLSIVSTLLFAAGCGGDNRCNRACKRISTCKGETGAASTGNCGLSASCTASESCAADCLLSAPCGALTGEDRPAAAALATCQLLCSEVEPDGGGAADRGPMGRDSKLTNEGLCVRACDGRQCGNDGCGGSCGSCASPKVCTTAGQCVTTCTRSCSGRQCGSDGCGGVCGTGACPSGMACNASGKCVSSCTPSCGGKQCGSDGCSGSCGSCASPKICTTSGLCEQPGCSPPFAATANSGKICYSQSDCSSAEVCQAFSSTATRGMCIGRCCPNTADPNDPNAFCPVASTSTQVAICAYELRDNAGNLAPYNGCAWLCSATQSGKITTFSCPNSTDFNCVPDSTDPSWSFCEPK